jgi:hypothetical protein
MTRHSLQTGQLATSTRDIEANEKGRLRCALGMETVCKCVCNDVADICRHQYLALSTVNTMKRITGARSTSTKDGGRFRDGRDAIQSRHQTPKDPRDLGDHLRFPCPKLGNPLPKQPVKMGKSSHLVSCKPKNNTSPHQIDKATAFLRQLHQRHPHRATSLEAPYRTLSRRTPRPDYRCRKSRPPPRRHLGVQPTPRDVVRHVARRPRLGNRVHHGHSRRLLHRA